MQADASARGLPPAQIYSKHPGLLSVRLSCSFGKQSWIDGDMASGQSGLKLKAVVERILVTLVPRWSST